MDNKKKVVEDPYLEINKVVGELIESLNEAQQILAQEALKNQDSHPIFIKGKSLVNLICHDFCLYKYPFNRKYNFDYEEFVRIYLESERYDWLLEKIVRKIEEEWQIQSKESIKILYILSGSYTTETNNKNRQKKINQLRQILYYIFELNFVCTSFTRPSFCENIQYKQLINDVQQKLKNLLPFHFDYDCDDFKNPLDIKDSFTAKPKQSVFKSWTNFLGEVTICSVGETNKANNNGLLSFEILNLILCFKEINNIQDYIEQRLTNPNQQEEDQPLQNAQQDLLMFTISYLQFHAKNNYVIIDQQLEEYVEKSQQEKFKNSKVDSFFIQSNIKNKNSQPINQDSAYSIKSSME